MRNLKTNDSDVRVRPSPGKPPRLHSTHRRPSPIPVFIETLNAEERDDVRDALLVRRLNAVQQLLGQTDNLRGQDYLLALHRIMAASPEQMIDVVDRWPVGYLLERLANFPELGERVFCRLLADLLFAPSDGDGSPLRDCELRIPPQEEGRLPCLAQNGYLVFGDSECEQVIRFEAHSAASECRANKLGFPLPLHRDRSESAVKFVPFETVSKWNKPLVNAASMVLVDSPASYVRSSVDVARFHAMPLSRSLAEAHEILQMVLPQALPWVDTLIPAFVRVESTGKPGLRLSGSFGPSSPIYLSEVSDSFLHAEDILHELQHERFLLYLSKEQCFGTWDDEQHVFVSPYREDPRPLRGLHLGLHALIAVNEFRLRSLKTIPLTPARIRDMAVVHRKNLFAAMSVLQNDTPTLAGESYLSEMVNFLTGHDEAIRELATKRMLTDAVAFVREHINKVAGLEPDVRNGYAKWASIKPVDLNPK
jgi:HEXXH motif-containing protein